MKFGTMIALLFGGLLLLGIILGHIAESEKAANVGKWAREHNIEIVKDPEPTDTDREREIRAFSDKHNVPIDDVRRSWRR